MMRLKDLIAYLEAKPEDAVATPGFSSPHSYRGWYEQIAFTPEPSATAGEMLAHAKSAIGATFHGWKGGEYKMGPDSFINIAEAGYCGDDDEITFYRLDAMFNCEPKPAREWVGLTEDEVCNFVSAVWPREATPADYIRAIEAKLREKNGGNA